MMNSMLLTSTYSIKENRLTDRKQYMYYVIMDLEWNNAYSRKIQGFVNEILEVGAVMVDENMDVIDTFSSIVKLQLSKKVRSRIKNLTHISNEAMNEGISFPKVMKNFSEWIGNRNCVFMSWGDSDIRVLYNNFSVFLNINRIPFLTQYVDLQKYCEEFIVSTKNRQIGLVDAAVQMGIDVRQCNSHRALDDSLLGLRCLKRCFNREHLLNCAVICDSSFYQKIMFKARYITNLNNPVIDKNQFKCACPVCNVQMKRISEWKLSNRRFSAVFFCKSCDKVVRYMVGFKEYYDHIDVKKNITEITEKEPEN